MREMINLDILAYIKAVIIPIAGFLLTFLPLGAWKAIKMYYFCCQKQNITRNMEAIIERTPSRITVSMSLRRWNRMLQLEETYKGIKTKLHINSDSFIWKAFCVGRTFVLISIFRFFSLSPDMGTALSTIAHAFTNFRIKEINHVIFFFKNISSIFNTIISS